VMSALALRSRPTWVRLVLSRVAILFLEIFLFFMASANCHATTSLTACACASSKMPSSLRKSPMLEPSLHPANQRALVHRSVSAISTRGRAWSSDARRFPNWTFPRSANRITLARSTILRSLVPARALSTRAMSKEHTARAARRTMARQPRNGC
jgi:hypothetical protein